MRFIIVCVFSVLVLAGIVRAAPGSRGLIELGFELAPEIQDRNASYIIMHPEEEYSLGSGGNISIPLTVYRGATLKRTLYVWVEDSAGKVVSSKAKLSLPSRFTHYNLSANISFPACIGQDDYWLVAEGLDTGQRLAVRTGMAGCTSEGYEPGLEEGSISFSILDSPDVVEAGMPFRTRLLISNPTELHIEVDAWSYVYRSSVCYSGEREQNRKTVNLPEFSNVTFDLENTVNASAGEYSLKIKFLRSDRKTPHEMTVQISVVGNSRSVAGASSNTDKLSISGHDDETGDDSVTRNNSTSGKSEKRALFSSNISAAGSPQTTVYRSSSAKAWSIAVYFLIAVLVLILIALIFRRL